MKYQKALGDPATKSGGLFDVNTFKFISPGSVQNSVSALDNS